MKIRCLPMNSSLRGRVAIAMTATVASVATIVFSPKMLLGQPRATAPLESDGEVTVRLRLDDAKEYLVKATISPIDYTTNGFHEKWGELTELKPAVLNRVYAAQTFEVFLPPKPAAVGDTWEINEDVIQLIRQLHANATLKLHIDPAENASGRWALLRACNERYAEIVFRVHADIPLKKGFLTFSQFTGRLVIDQANQEVVFFRMFVPDAAINFDVNWDALHIASTELGGYVTDMGRCPLVELVSGNSDHVDVIRWFNHIQTDDAELRLARKFYSAWQINWQPLERAVELAKRLKKPIHVVSADGPFKDEAC